jgi:hypothetical protein
MMQGKQVCHVRAGDTHTLVDFVAGKLDPASAVSLQRHAADCALCQEFLAAQAAVWAALEADAAPEVSATFDAELYRKIAAVDTESWWKRAWRRIADPVTHSFARPAAALSVAMTVMLAVVLMRTPQPELPAPAAGQNAVLLNADLDAIEETLNDLEMLQALGELPRAL